MDRIYKNREFVWRRGIYESKALKSGNSHIPVRNVMDSLNWYTENLGAAKSYRDEKGKMAIINMASQSFFHLETPQRGKS